MRTTFDRAFYRPAGIAAAITDDALGIEVYYESALIAHAYLREPAQIAPGVKVFAPDHWTAYA